MQRSAISEGLTLGVTPSPLKSEQEGVRDPIRAGKPARLLLHRACQRLEDTLIVIERLSDGHRQRRCRDKICFTSVTSAYQHVANTLTTRLRSSAVSSSVNSTPRPVNASRHPPAGHVSQECSRYCTSTQRIHSRLLQPRHR